MNPILDERQKEIEIIEAIELRASLPKKPVGRPRVPEEQKKQNRNVYEKNYQNLKYKNDPVFREMKKRCCMNYINKKREEAGVEVKRVGRPSKTIEEKKARQKAYYLMRKALKMQIASNESILESQDQDYQSPNQFQNQNQDQNQDQSQGLILVQ